MKRITMTVLIWLVAVWPVAGAESPLEVKVWPGLPPLETGTIGPEKVFMSAPKAADTHVAEPTKLVTNVTKPTLTIYRPAKEKDTGAAVLICPGGGYHALYWQVEGEEVAAWLNSIGVTGIILKYRVPRRPGEIKTEPAPRPLQDAQRAVSLTRSKAAEWRIDPKRIGIMGFSAGGHLAAATAVNFDKRTYAPVDAVDKVSCRPDFAIPVYPGYLRVKGDKDELVPSVRHIPEGTPPFLFVHGNDDPVGGSNVANSVLMYLALKRAGVSAELHVFATARHGFGVRQSGHPVSAWTRLCADWLREQGFLKARN
jgi:acetyl esterase/lipase